MEVAATVKCLFLFLVWTVAMAYKDQMIELDVVIHVHDPSSHRWR